LPATCVGFRLTSKLLFITLLDGARKKSGPRGSPFRMQQCFWLWQYQLASYLLVWESYPIKKSLSYRLTKEIHLSRKFLLQLAHLLAN